MSKQKYKDQKPKRHKDNGPLRGDQLSRSLNKHLGLPEDFKGSIEGFENTLPLAIKVFGASKVEEVTHDKSKRTKKHRAH